MVNLDMKLWCQVIAGALSTPTLFRESQELGLESRRAGPARGQPLEAR